MKKSISVLMIVILCLSLWACGQEKSDDVWSEAIYTEDTELGDGEKTVTVEVSAEDKSVIFTIHSDKSTLGEAMAEHGLVEGEPGAYGLYVKKVNGILADYDKNQCYWGFNKGGESLMTGVDGEEIKGGEHYEIIYTK